MKKPAPTKCSKTRALDHSELGHITAGLHVGRRKHEPLTAEAADDGDLDADVDAPVDAHSGQRRGRRIHSPITF